jgi:hypothetical protein
MLACRGFTAVDLTPRFVELTPQHMGSSNCLLNDENLRDGRRNDLGIGWMEAIN